jgi:branched-subunit amino acid aminotransferase/4-amino-4-deoxychorismate lyase
MNKWAFAHGGFRPIEDVAFGPSNRSFAYGDGLFESIRIINRKPLFFEAHCNRLHNGMRTCGIDFNSLTAVALKGIADELIQKNEVLSGKLKLVVFRSDGGLYTPEHDDPQLLMVCESLESPEFNWNNKGLQTGLYTAIKKPLNLLAEIKSNASLLYVLAARDARLNAWDEIFLLNERGNLCEGSASNVFLVDDSGIVHTPALMEGALPGIMRGVLLRLMREAGMQCVERKIGPEELLNAREVFVSNAVQGIRWVVSYEEKRYFNAVGKKIFHLLQGEMQKQLSV